MNLEMLGLRLRSLRGDRTLSDVADATGIGISALNNYELGLRMPRDEVKIVLAKYYGLSIGELFYPDEITKREE